MTEENAKRKWCPFARVSTFHPAAPACEAAVNRQDGDGAPSLASLCIASNCMAWRWDGLAQEGWCGFAGKDGAP